MKIITSLNAYRDVIRQIEHVDTLFLDTETTGLDPYTTRLLLLSMRAGGETYVIDFTKINLRHLQELRKALTTKRCVWQNATFDWKFIYHNAGIEMRNLHCTMITEQLLIAGLRGVSASLQAITQRRIQVELDKNVREEFIGKEDNVFSHKAYEYAALDVDVLEPIYYQQLKDIAREDLQRVYDLEMALLPVTATMEYVGISIDRNRLEEALPVFQAFARKADKAIQDIVIQNSLARVIVFTRDGYTAVNTASPVQMLKLAHEFGIDVKSLNKKDLVDWDAKWSVSKNKKVNFFFDTDEEEDEDVHIAYNHPFLRRHAIRTAVEKILGTYTEGLISKINPVTHRIHTNYKQLGAARTGRYSSVQPNLQNLPQSGKLKALGLQDHDIRSMFIPSPGRKFIICDFSGIEAVILAAWSQDENMLNQLHGDIHSYVATQLFGTEVSKQRANEKIEPDLTLRTVAKTLTYAIMYGTTAWNLYRSLSMALASVGIRMTQDDGDRYINAWHALFPQAGKVLKENAHKAITQYYVTTALGRRRRWERKYLTTNGAWHAAEREGSNAPIQGGSADITKLSLLKSDHALDHRQSCILLCVHDEIVVEADDRYVEEAAAILKACMEDAGYELYPAAKEYRLIKTDPKISMCYDK